MKYILVFDIGATKCAVGIMCYDEVSARLTLLESAKQCLLEATCLDALFALLQQQVNFDFKKADAVCIAAAGRYHDGVLHLENAYPYPMTIDCYAKKQNWQHVVVVHDYTPIACATFTDFTKQSEHILTINPGKADTYGRRLVLGVGTGLGIKDIILLSNHDFWLGENEAGHMGLPFPPLAQLADQKRHRALLRFLRKSDTFSVGEAITFESILSGRGVERLYRFINENQSLSAKDISRHATQIACRKTWELFAWYLGLFVSSLQLAMMPSGGIWMSGGVLRQNTHIFDTGAFLDGIAAIPAYYAERCQFPIYLMLGNQHVFYGGAYYVIKRVMAKGS